jgi:hypothetical protein
MIHTREFCHGRREVLVQEHSREESFNLRSEQRIVLHGYIAEHHLHILQIHGSYITTYMSSLPHYKYTVNPDLISLGDAGFQALHKGTKV